MAPKKHSGFMMFLNEFRKKREGQRMSVAQATQHCGEIWKRMTAQQRGPYLSNAKDANVRSNVNRGPLNCHGYSISNVDKEEQLASNNVLRMKRHIEEIVRNGKNSHDLENTKFVLVSFNYFVKGLHTDIYLPAEFSACEFSLKGGINSIYSSMINPGQLIFGQSYDAMAHSNSTHQLPLPPSAMGEANMVKLYESIQDYLRSRLDPKIKDPKTLVVYTPTEEMTMVKSCFRFIETGCEDAYNSDDDDYISAGSQLDRNFLPIAVYDIQYLFLTLKKEARGMAGLPIDNISIYITDAFFLRDFFEYQDGISCQFHEKKDLGKYCTQSKVNRWAYTFCDYICGDLAIPIKPGAHMPLSYKSQTKHQSNDSLYSLSTAEIQSQENTESFFSDTASEISNLTTSMRNTTTDESKVQLTTSDTEQEPEPEWQQRPVKRVNKKSWKFREITRAIHEFTDEDFSMDSHRKVKTMSTKV